jgi:hypothetical protein
VLFGSPAAAIGKTVTVARRQFVVLGVMKDYGRAWACGAGAGGVTARDALMGPVAVVEAFEFAQRV